VVRRRRSAAARALAHVPARRPAAALAPHRLPPGGRPVTRSGAGKAGACALCPAPPRLRR
jgi:hypothetical protein